MMSHPSPIKPLNPVSYALNPKFCTMKNDKTVSHKLKCSNSTTEALLLVTRTGISIMTKCKGPHHDFDDFTTYDLTTFTTSRLVIDLETGFTVQK